MWVKTLSAALCALAFVLPAVMPGTASASDLYQQTIESQNPLAYWRFNDSSLGTGDTISADVGSTISTATNASGVTIGNSGPNYTGMGPNNTSFSYDGSPNAITYQLLDPNQAVMSSDAGSVSYWFRRADSGGDTAVLFFGTNRTATNGQSDAFNSDTLATWLTTGGRAGLAIGNDHQVGLLSSPYNYLYSDGNWHQAVATWDRTTGIMSFYLDGGDNGGLASSKTYTADFSSALWDSFQFTTDRFGKAKYSSKRFFPGDADELAVWNRPLTSSEVLAQWNAAGTLVPVPEPATLALLALGGLCAIGGRRRRKA